LINANQGEDFAIYLEQWLPFLPISQ